MSEDEIQRTETEQKILEAAQTVFLKKGMDGAKMQEIANEAGINKALLHYYYRTKEKLFDTVFKVAIKHFLPKIEGIVASDIEFDKKIEMFVANYMDLVIRNQFIPLFVLNELNRNPNRILDLVKRVGFSPKFFIDFINNEIKKGTIQPIEPKQLIVNLIALCIFPIVGRPMIQAIAFEGNKKEYDEFLKTRKVEVPKFFLNAIGYKKNSNQ